MTADERTNSLIIVADLPKTQEVLALVEKLDVETPRGKDRVHVYYLENALAEDLAKVLTGVVQDKGAKAAAGPGRRRPRPRPSSSPVTISPDKATNSLVITAAPNDYQVLEGIIRKLDVMRAQVLVEAFIAELSLSKSQQPGLLLPGEQPNPEVLRPQRRARSPSAASTPTQHPGRRCSPTPPPGPAAAIGAYSRGSPRRHGHDNGGRPHQGHSSRDADTNILSTPHLLTMDNEEAEIVVGEQRPFLKSDLTSTEGDGPITKTFEYKDVGLKLKITPHITARASTSA